MILRKQFQHSGLLEIWSTTFGFGAVSIIVKEESFEFLAPEHQVSGPWALWHWRPYTFLLTLKQQACTTHYMHPFHCKDEFPVKKMLYSTVLFYADKRAKLLFFSYSRVFLRGPRDDKAVFLQVFTSPVFFCMCIRDCVCIPAKISLNWFFFRCFLLPWQP